MRPWPFNRCLPSLGAEKSRPPLPGLRGMSCSPGPRGAPGPRHRCCCCCCCCCFPRRPWKPGSAWATLGATPPPGRGSRSPPGASTPSPHLPGRGGHRGGPPFASSRGLPSPRGGSAAPGHLPAAIRPAHSRHCRGGPGRCGRREAPAGRAERSREAG